MSDLSYSGVDFHLWHSRYMGVSQDKVLRESKIVNGVEITGDKAKFPCHDCKTAKAKRRTFQRKRGRNKKYLKPGDMVYTDVTGPHIRSVIYNCEYAVSFIDHYTESRFVYYIKKKSDVLEALK